MGNHLFATNLDRACFVRSSEVNNETDQPDLPPIECAHQWITDTETVLSAPIEDIAELDFTRILIMVHPGIETHVPKPNTIFYTVHDVAAKELAIAATGNTQAQDVLLEIARSNIWNGEPVPGPMRAHICGLLRGMKLGGRGRTTIYRDVDLKRLPKPVKVGGRLYWAEADIDAAFAAHAE